MEKVNVEYTLNPFTESEKNRMYNMLRKAEGKRYTNVTITDRLDGYLYLGFPSNVKAKEESIIPFLVGLISIYKTYALGAVQMDAQMKAKGEGKGVSVDYVSGISLELDGRRDLQRFFEREYKDKNSLVMKTLASVKISLCRTHNAVVAAVKERRA